MSEKFILIYDDSELEKTHVEYFGSLEKVTEFVTGEKLLPSEFQVYQILKEIKFKLVPTNSSKPTSEAKP